MVSLKKIFKRYQYCLLLASILILGSATKSFAALELADRWLCLIGETKCCINGVKSCCEDNGTLYDTISCNGGTSCGISGTKQYKYTADSDCGYSTSTRTCCSNGSWSGWDASCPTTKTCSSSSKPSTRATCTGGYKYRTVTCNTSTGTWTTGAWGSCDCSDSEYESIPLETGGTCCQRKDGTGPRCATGKEEVGYRWVKAGTNCRSKGECGWGSCSGSCSTPGSECTTWVNNGMSAVAQGCAHYDTGDRGICQAYYCQ